MRIHHRDHQDDVSRNAVTQAACNSQGNNGMTSINEQNLRTPEGFLRVKEQK